MNFTSFTIRLLLLFLPGIISIILIDTFTIHRRWEGYKYFLYSFVLGLLCYLFWHLMKPVLLLIPYFVSEQDFIFFKYIVI
jgi:membrane glycosyltransferase